MSVFLLYVPFMDEMSNFCFNIKIVDKEVYGNDFTLPLRLIPSAYQILQIAEDIKILQKSALELWNVFILSLS